MSYEIRTLSGDEIDAVAGGGAVAIGCGILALGVIATVSFAAGLAFGAVTVAAYQAATSGDSDTANQINEEAQNSLENPPD
jgi:hypothetical protein